MERKLLNVIGVSTSNVQHNTFALVLGVSDTVMRIPIIIGPFEAQAIAIELEGMSPSRPLSHDLMKSLLTSYNIEVIEVYINRFEQGVFYSIITLFDGAKTVSVDSRTSDAIALAVRFKCKIFTNDKVIEQTAMIEGLEDDDEIISNSDEELEDDSMSLEELEEYLKQLIEQEDYEKASTIRDEINRIKSAGK